MKNIIYLVIVGILILVSIISLLFYYTQNFSEQLNIIKSIDYNDITIKTDVRDSQTYLTSAEAIIGELKLENKGYFTQKYTIPQLFGCINLNEDNQRNLRFNIQATDSVNNQVMPYKYNYNTDTIDIPVGEIKILKIKAIYNEYNTLLSTFSRENLLDFEIYQIPKKESNPLGETYYSNDYYDCNNLKDLTPIATIQTE